MELFSKPKLLVLSVFMLIALNSSGCVPKVNDNDFKKASTMSRIMDSWVGHYQSELITSWGPPTKNSVRWKKVKRFVSKEAVYW